MISREAWYREADAFSEVRKAEQDVLRGVPGSFDRLVRLRSRTGWDAHEAVDLAVKARHQVMREGLYNVEAAKLFTTIEKSVHDVLMAMKKPMTLEMYPDPMYHLWLSWMGSTEIVFVDEETGRTYPGRHVDDHSMDPLKALTFQGRVPKQVPLFDDEVVTIEFNKGSFWRKPEDYPKPENYRAFVVYHFPGHSEEELRNAVMLANWEAPSLPLKHDYELKEPTGD